MQEIKITKKMAHIQIRISDEEKKIVQEAFQKMGMTMSSGIKIFLRRVAVEKKMPFEIVETAFPKKIKKMPATPKTKIVEAEPILEKKEELITISQETENSEEIKMIEFEKKITPEKPVKTEEKKPSNFNKWNLFEKHEIG